MYTRLRCFLDYTVSTTVRNLNSLCRDSLAQIEERSSSIVWYKLLRVKVQKVHFSWTKLGFADPYLRNLNLICRCGMYIETLPFPKTDFQLPTEVPVTWQKRPPYLIWQYLLGVLGEFLSVTSQLMVESRNDRAENARVLGCIRRWGREVGGSGGVGGDTGGTSEGFHGKIAIKLVAKNSIFLFMCRDRSLMKDLYVYGDE